MGRCRFLRKDFRRGEAFLPFRWRLKYQFANQLDNADKPIPLLRIQQPAFHIFKAQAGYGVGEALAGLALVPEQ